jgi:hypothetical protein
MDERGMNSKIREGRGDRDDLTTQHTELEATAICEVMLVRREHGTTWWHTCSV